MQSDASSESIDSVPAFPTPPEKRTYIHQTCRKGTCVSGRDLEWVCNPFLPYKTTMCGACRAQRPFSEFSWADTGESLAAYRERLRNATPAWYRKAQRLIPAALFAGTVVGLLCGLAIGRGSLHAMVMGAGAGVLIGSVLALTMRVNCNRVKFRQFK